MKNEELIKGIRKVEKKGKTYYEARKQIKEYSTFDEIRSIEKLKKFTVTAVVDEKTPHSGGSVGREDLVQNFFVIF